MALGANEIVMSDFGEFGPLDVQIYKTDEFARSSGLDIHQSLHVIGN
jgi:ClpP class serine protease